MANYTGTVGDDSLVGTDNADYFDVTQGGNDRVIANGGDDVANFGATYTSDDTIYGGAGTDTLELQGDYSTNTTITDTSIQSVERVQLDAGFNYNLTFANGSYASNMVVDGSALGAGNSMTVDVSSVNIGASGFTLIGGAGDDVFKGGVADISHGGNDVVYSSSVIAGAALNSGDRLLTTGRLYLDVNGDYAGGLTLDRTIIPNALMLSQLKLEAGHNYNVAIDGDFSLGQLTDISAASLGAGNSLTLDLTQATGTRNLTAGGGDTAAYAVEGGAGSDTVVMPGSVAADSLRLFVATDPQRNYVAEVSATGSYTESNIQHAVFFEGFNVERVQFADATAAVGTLGADTMGPLPGINAYVTGPGNDVVTVGSGAQFVSGGDGSDTVIESGALADYVVGTDGYGNITLTGDGNTLTLSAVETVMLADGSITLGTSGVDTLTGAGGEYFGGAGSDKITSTTGSGTALFTGNEAQYTVTKVQGGVYKVADNRSGSPDGADTVTGITTLKFADGSESLPPDAAPVVTTANVTEPANTTMPLSGLFSYSDADGDAATMYQLWDSTSDPYSGHFTVNGVGQAPNTVITISASQLAQTSFVTGTVGDALQIRAFDGVFWSAADNAAWSPFQVFVGDHPPMVTTQNMTLAHGSTTPLISLFTYSDPDGDAATQYQLWDSTRDPASGHFVLNGVAQAAGTVITVSAAQLSSVGFVAGAVGDSLQIRASDGTYWSAGDNAVWAPFTVSVPADQAPVVTTSNVTLQAGVATPLSSLFTYSDADGDAATQYQLWDSTGDPNSGHFVVGGITQASGTIITISAIQLAQTSFVAGTVGNSLQIRASDGALWSAGDNAAWSPFTVTPKADPHAPMVTTSNLTLHAGASIPLSNLFQVSDADGDAMTQYQLWDSTQDSNSGHFVVNGMAQPAATIITVSAAQLAQTSFTAGTVGDSLQIRAFDGQQWSAGDNAAWSPFSVSIGPDTQAPMVTTSNLTLHSGSTVSLSSLFSYSNSDNGQATQYQLWDSTRDANSGHFVVNGMAQAAGTVITVSAAQLAQTSFTAGAVGDMLQIRAYDGQLWSAGDNAAWSPFTVTASNAAPVVATTDVTKPADTAIPLASLFSYSDSDGDAATEFQLWDSTRDTTSGHFVINGVAQAAGAVIDLPAAQLSGAYFMTGTTGDTLQIRASDGFTWSAGDNAAWSPFHVAVG